MEVSGGPCNFRGYACCISLTFSLTPAHLAPCPGRAKLFYVLGQCRHCWPGHRPHCGWCGTGCGQKGCPKGLDVFFE